MVPLENLFRARPLSAVVGMNGNQDVPALDLPFVLLRFQLGDAVAPKDTLVEELRLPGKTFQFLDQVL